VHPPGGRPKGETKGGKVQTERNETGRGGCKPEIAEEHSKGGTGAGLTDMEVGERNPTNSRVKEKTRSE